MKSTGIIRRIDDLGRVVIPKEIRRNLGIYEGEPLEIYIVDNGVAFRKFELNLLQETKTLWEKMEQFIPYNDPNRLEIMKTMSKAMDLLREVEKRD